MEEKKFKRKKIVLIVVILVLIIAIAGVVAGIFINDFSQRSIIGTEMKKINTSGEVDPEIKSSGKYAEVEKAIKNYVIEYQNITSSIADQATREKLNAILSFTNYQNDGPEFVESKKMIEDTKKQVETTKAKLSEMISDDFKDRRADELGLTGKYKDLFKSILQLNSESNDINASIDDFNLYLSKLDDVFTYLRDNKDKWQIIDGFVKFKSQSQLNKYNSLVIMVNTVADRLK